MSQNVSNCFRSTYGVRVRCGADRTVRGSGIVSRFPVCSYQKSRLAAGDRAK